MSTRPATPRIGVAGRPAQGLPLPSPVLTAVLVPSGSALGLLPEVERQMLSAVGVSATAEMPTRSPLLRACTHHLCSGGQRVRAHLALHAGVALGMRDADAVTIAATAELLHNASLIHDDLQDRSEQRRGAPTVHIAFGAAIALCAGDLLLSGAYRTLAGYSGTDTLPWLLALTHDAVAEAAQGQIADSVAPRGSGDMVSWYLSVAAAKSGALLRLPLELALAASGLPNALPLARRAAEAFAIGYQIADDIEDVDADMAAGSLNLLVLLMAAGPSGAAVARRLAQQHLAAAHMLAHELPEGSGRYLGQLAKARAAQL